MSSYTKKGVAGGSKWRADTGYTEVRLDGWCESSSSSSRTDRWVHFQQNTGLRLFVHT